MNDQPPPSITAGFGSDVHARVIEYIETLRAATVDAVTAAPDPLHEMSLVMTAAVMFAGTLYGQAVASGADSDSHKRVREVTGMMDRNFRSGMKAGMARAARVAAEQGMMN